MTSEATPSSARLALNCILTAYHLHEWVWGGWVKSDAKLQATLGVKTKKDFLAWIDRAWPWFSLIQDLANGAKHFGRPPGIQTSKVEGYGQGPYGVGPYGEGYLLIDLGEGAVEYRWMPAVHLIEGTVRFWKNFFQKFKPDANVPVSSHHLNLDGQNRQA
jgi:hypothetical protein